MQVPKLDEPYGSGLGVKRGQHGEAFCRAGDVTLVQKYTFIICEALSSISGISHGPAYSPPSRHNWPPQFKGEEKKNEFTLAQTLLGKFLMPLLLWLLNKCKNNCLSAGEMTQLVGVGTIPSTTKVASEHCQRWPKDKMRDGERDGFRERNVSL